MVQDTVADIRVVTVSFAGTTFPHRPKRLRTLSLAFSVVLQEKPGGAL
jgi:hypothetical protein